jgi:hypothetical protein
MDAQGLSLFPNRLASSLDEKSRSKASVYTTFHTIAKRADEPTITTTTTTTTTKRTKASHIDTQTRAPDLPIKDPSKHTSARVRASYKGPPCDEDVTRNEENEKWFKYDQKNEAEVDAWLQEVLPRLEAGEKNTPPRHPRHRLGPLLPRILQPVPWLGRMMAG